MLSQRPPPDKVNVPTRHTKGKHSPSTAHEVKLISGGNRCV